MATRAVQVILSKRAFHFRTQSTANPTYVYTLRNGIYIYKIENISYFIEVQSIIMLNKTMSQVDGDSK